MNRKGFTLVELIVIIGLLGVLAIVIGVNTVGIQGKQKEKNYQAFKSKLESAACVYMSEADQLSYKRNCRNNPNSTDCNVSVSTLVSKGLIGEDLVDPRTNKEVDQTLIVKVKWENYEQVCELQE